MPGLPGQCTAGGAGWRPQLWKQAGRPQRVRLHLRALVPRRRAGAGLPVLRAYLRLLPETHGLFLPWNYQEPGGFGGRLEKGHCLSPKKCNGCLLCMFARDCFRNEVENINDHG